MGKGWEGIAASNGGNNPFGSCEAFAKTFSRRQEEDRGSRTRSLGEVQSGEEESPLEPLSLLRVRNSYPRLAEST
jgi:hypothetical protein